MNLIDVNVKSIDENSKYLYPNRTIQIRTSSNLHIDTPTRAATDYEFNQKALIPTDIPFDNPAYMSSTNISLDEFEKFMHKNGYYSNIINRMELKSRLSLYSNLRLFLLKPTVTDKKDEKTGIKHDSPMKILTQSSFLLERFIRLIIQMQTEVGLDLISIPFIDLRYEEYEKLINEVDSNLEKLNKQAVFFIDMGYKSFEKVIDLLVNKKQANLIGLYYKPYRKAHLSYETLKEYIDKDVAFLSSQVTRSDIYDISTMHYLPFFYNDIYAVKRPLGFTKMEKDKNGNKIKIPPAYSISDIQLFNKETLCIQSLTKTPALIEAYANEYKNDSFIRNLLDNYETAQGDQDKYPILNAFSKVSELKSSLSEFANFQKYVRQNSTKDYIDEKQTLKRTLKAAKPFSFLFE